MPSQISKNQILNSLKEEKPFLQANFGVTGLWLFGSYSKDQAQTESDIDLLVELKAPRFDWLAGIQVHLEKKFNRKIELVRKGKHLDQQFLRQIEKDILYVD